MADKTYKFVVEVTIPNAQNSECRSADLKEYIGDAVRTARGALHWDEPIQDFKEVVVKQYRKPSQYRW